MPFASPLDFQYSKLAPVSLPRRLLAVLLDTVLVGTSAEVLGPVLGYQDPLSLRQFSGLHFAFAFLALFLLYPAVSEHFFGATAGQALLGIRVVDVRTGDRPTLSQTFKKQLTLLVLLVPNTRYLRESGPGYFWDRHVKVITTRT